MIVKSGESDHEVFLGRAIDPVAGSFDTAAMSRGEPGLPRQFILDGKEIVVAGVIETWKTSGPCRHGSGEMYLRRHWWRIVTADGATMTLYCDRQAKDRKRPKARWWAFSVTRTNS